MASRLLINRREFALLAATGSGVALLGCSTEDNPPPEPAAREPVVLPPLETAQLSTERTIVPDHAVASPPETRDPLVPEDRAALLAEGFGDYHVGPGEAVLDRMPDGSTPPASGAGAQRLARFVHASDLHVTDDESPARLASFDEPDSFDGAARPQAAYVGRMLNAMVRTLNALHDDDPIDFFLASGDCVDSALANELGWCVDILSGAPSVACDSGAPDDPTPGSGNDPKDPFAAAGLAMPWYYCMGNHDALIMGVTEITPGGVATATGSYCAAGARDWSQPGAPVAQGDWIADPERRPLSRDETIALIAADGFGHGLDGLGAGDKVCHVLDVEGTPVRLIVYDTASETGGSEGLLRRSELDGFLRPALDEAASAGKWVVLVCHHPLRSIVDDGLASDEARAEAVPAAELEQLFGSYDNVILSLTGHTHDHSIQWVDGDPGGFWEVQTCSLVEFPNQVRLVEITDEDNGQLSIQLVGVDFATNDDPVAEEGRRLAILDHTAGWGHGSPGDGSDRNVRLFVPRPG